MRVFITGASGYIGFHVAAMFRRAGYEVWGLARNEEKAHVLARHEVHPVLGTMQDLGTYLPVAETCSVLVHTAADYQTDTFALDRKTVDALLSLRQVGPRPKTFIYTSGIWVYGSTGGVLVDETSLPKPPRLVAARPEIERAVLTAPGIRGLVIRPGNVYGLQGGLTGLWFKGATIEHALTIAGDGRNHWAMVHAEDLADGYVRAAESGLSGEIFNLADHSQATVGDMVSAVARATGYAGRIEYLPLAEASKMMGDFAEALALDQFVDARKAMRLLNWRPRHEGFVSGVQTYYSAWRAYQR